MSSKKDRGSRKKHLTSLRNGYNSGHPKKVFERIIIEGSEGLLKAKNVLSNLLSENRPYTTIPPDLFESLGEDIVLPDGGQMVKNLADKAPGGAFDPRDLEKILPRSLGYRAKWIPLRYEYYGLQWDITALKLETLSPNAQNSPWIVMMNGGAANFYEFFLDPLNNPGLGQYLAQQMNVLLVTIPGNFKYEGWELPPSKRSPQYLLDQDLPEPETKSRNAIYTNKMVLEGVKRLIMENTTGDILLVGHSTSGEISFLAMGERDLTLRLKGRFLGWGSGGPANLCQEWEEKVLKKGKDMERARNDPPLWELRTRNGGGYVKSGYIGPLNPVAKEGMTDLEVAEKWLKLEERRRPNFKQVLQSIEHRGLEKLRFKMEKEIRTILSQASLPIKETEVFRDLFASNKAPLQGYQKMVWVVAKWDKGHWNKMDENKARELTVADQFREKNPRAVARILLFDVPMTHYGHIEKSRQVAGGLIASTRWIL